MVLKGCLCCGIQPIFPILKRRPAMKRTSACLLWLLVVMLVSPVWGQGVLVVIDHPHPRPIPLPRPIPRPVPIPISYKIKELTYQAKITDQVAQVQVSQTFVNTGSGQIEASFVFPLPPEGAVERMTFMVDGKEFDAKILPAKEAREIFESHVRRNKDPALLEWLGYGMLKTSVFPIPPGAERKVTLKFSQLLRKTNQLTDLLIPLAAAKYTSSPLDKLTIEATIESTIDIKSVYSPTHAINVQRPDAKRAMVKFEVTSAVPTTDFRLLYDTADGKLGASLISYRPDANDDGYFLLLASPEVKSESMERPAKTVVFVLDRSGSMSGKKIEQAKEAARFVLNNLRQGDTFNIVAYDSTVESFKPELQKYDDETRKAALGFIDGIYAGGSTNIDGAITTAMGMLKDESRPSYVLFLTDGLPTTGETNEAKIAANAKSNNKVRARMVNFGMGYDVNSRLLDRLSRDNFGQSEYVRPDENIEASVSRLYGRMSAPVMTNVAVKVDVDAADASPAVNRVYPKEVYDLFAGDQLVMVGRYKRPGGAKVTITGKIGTEKRKFDFPGTLIDKSNDQSFGFVEKLWAMRRVGEILDELDLKGKNDELVNELVALATKHGLLTPYTSFLADETARPGQLADVRANVELARRGLARLEEAEGRSGVAQRTVKEQFRAAGAVPAASAPGGFGGGIGGTDGGRGGLRLRDIDSDREIAAGDAVQTYGNQTIYKRGKVLIAANAQEVDPEKDADKIKTVDRFSDEYFALVKDNTREENLVLANQSDEDELIIKLRGQVYRIR
jgi:Ca-activated chloride channel family protein